jgi:hypothetical protein
LELNINKADISVRTYLLFHADCKKVTNLFYIIERCRYRGLAKAKIHTLLSAIVSNVKRMARPLWKEPEIPGKVAPVPC